MTEPSPSTIKKLLARSGNRCAFPNCTLPIVEDSGILTGVVCHIKARSPAGPRYDPTQTPEARHSYENLIVMCARHGRLIDADPAAYPVELLYAIKAAHEKKCGSVEIGRSDALKADALLAGYRDHYNVTASGHVMLNSAGAVQATNVTIKNANRSVKVLPAEGSLGASPVHRNYVKHLDRAVQRVCQQSDWSGPGVLPWGHLPPDQVTLQSGLGADTDCVFC